MYYLNYFFVFSILGHIVESFVYSDGQSGILYGWWTPIYGFGIIIILLLYKCIDKLNIKEIKKGLVLFITSALILMILEFISGHLIELIFNVTFWDYSNLKLNIGKYTSIEMGLIWGIASIVFIYWLKPFLDKIISKIPKYFTYLLIIIFILDLFLTIIIKH